MAPLLYPIVPRRLAIALVGDPILETSTERLNVEEIQSVPVQELIADMVHTCIESGGVGLAAPQVGRSLQIIVVASHPTPAYPDAPEMEPLVMINPSTHSPYPDQYLKGWEGCLSVPGLRALISRPAIVDVRYYQRDGSLALIQRFDHPFVARIIQHEIDHLYKQLIIGHPQAERYAVESEWVKHYGSTATA